MEPCGGVVGKDECLMLTTALFNALSGYEEERRREITLC